MRRFLEEEGTCHHHEHPHGCGPPSRLALTTLASTLSALQPTSPLSKRLASTAPLLWLARRVEAGGCQRDCARAQSRHVPLARGSRGRSALRRRRTPVKRPELRAGRETPPATECRWCARHRHWVGPEPIGKASAAHPQAQSGHASAGRFAGRGCPCCTRSWGRRRSAGHGAGGGLLQFGDRMGEAGVASRSTQTGRAPEARGERSTACSGARGVLRHEFSQRRNVHTLTARPRHGRRLHVDPMAHNDLVDRSGPTH